MSGLQLGEMELAEMLDVIHVLFEEDFTNALSAEQVDAKTRVRKVIYKEFYNKTYNHGSSDNKSYVDEETINPAVDYSDVKPFDPKAAARKPYVPPTEFNPDSPKPFGKILDAPLG
jgi:CRISPR/Cas system-associated protein Cas5 (RAMP superfamily)